MFWPAAGISSGILIALGLHARWSVAAGVMAATIAANLMGDRNIWASTVFALCNVAEALITAGLIQRYFNTLSSTSCAQVLSLLAAAVVGTVISGIGGAVTFKLFHSPAVSMLTIWWQWFASDAVGIVAVAPLVIGLGAAVREPPPRSELIEGAAALVILAAMTGIIISLPQEPWKTVVPSALLFPLLLWLAARCRPVFAAAGAFLVSLTIVWTIIFGIGHFGDTGLPIDDRILEAQVLILVVALTAFVLAALFTERRESEARLARSNKLLQRERNNKLMNLEAMVASISHEIKQPLTCHRDDGGAALRFLGRTSPDLEEVRSNLNLMIGESHRASQVFDNILALFGKADSGHQPVDVNEITLKSCTLWRRKLKGHSITPPRADVRTGACHGPSGSIAGGSA